MFNLPALIESTAARLNLPPILISALIEQESSGNPWAWNPEPRYRYLWDVKRRLPFRTLTSAERDAEYPPADFPCLAGDRDQEWWGQQASWGLMQIMGAVARERGYAGGYLPALCDPTAGLQYGCAQLGHLRDVYLKAHGWDGVIAAYNAGSPRTLEGGGFPNQAYVDSVRKRLKGAQL